MEEKPPSRKEDNESVSRTKETKEKKKRSNRVDVDRSSSHSSINLTKEAEQQQQQPAEEYVFRENEAPPTESGKKGNKQDKRKKETKTTPKNTSNEPMDPNEKEPDEKESAEHEIEADNNNNNKTKKKQSKKAKELPSGGERKQQPKQGEGEGDGDEEEEKESEEERERRLERKRSQRIHAEDFDDMDDLEEPEEPEEMLSGGGEPPRKRDEAEVAPELKEKGQRRKMSAVDRLFRRKKKHIPKWNIYPAIHFNNPDLNATKRFSNNKVRTTKYTFYNFIPKNLFEQFRRATNFYFLLIVIITLVPQVSPLTPVTSIMPLVFVLLVSAIKEGYEDYMRYRSDLKSNNRIFQVLQTNGEYKSVPAKQLKVGDILKIQKDDPFPADLILLKSTLAEGLCYIDTAQLDGESNLKSLQAFEETDKVPEAELNKLNGVIECEEPHHHLYTFNARINMNDRIYSIYTKQLLLKGARLRNTPAVWGVLVYSGTDTKLALNQKQPPSKFSTLEKKLNKMVVGIFTFKFTCVLLLAIAAAIFQGVAGSDSWYYGSYADENAGLTAVKYFFSYFVLLSFLIPMSMMVTLEVVKVTQAKLMDWDKELRLDPNNPDSGMSAKTSNLNDELALVKYIFSDKTGTLTENRMEFAKCSIAGKVYHHPHEGQLQSILQKQNWNLKQEDPSLEVTSIVEFLRSLAICHGVILEEDPNSPEPIMQAQSPDELALVKVAQTNGFIFKARKIEGVTIEEQGSSRLYKILNNMEFTSERARSSVILRTPEGKIRLYMKGADSVVLSRLRADIKESALVTKTQKHIDKFSNTGLRTLLVGYKELTEEEYNKWYTTFHKANTSLKDREKKVEATYDAMERDILLLGCTAIEDKLQQGVPEAIDYLLQAGIKIWIITGDKQQTAINIGLSTKLLKPEQPRAVINIGEAEPPSLECQRQLQHAVDEFVKPNPAPIGVVIDGKSLLYALTDHYQLFLELTGIASSVVCCRVTPLQKAQIVRLIKKEIGEVCLSVGDGANDVSMIQEAHIGVGIYGNEGSQAARASDYAIQQFRHLKRLLVVHGRYSYIRNSVMIESSLYKNMAFFFIQFWYAFFNGFSAQTLYDDWIVTAYNIFLTSAPPFFLAVFEKDITEDIIEKYPWSYQEVQAGKIFTYGNVVQWLLSAFYHSIILFGVGFWLFWGRDNILPGGEVSDIWQMGQLISTAAILVVLHKIALETNYWTSINLLFHVISLVIYLLILVGISVFLSYWPQGYGLIQHLFITPAFWFALPLAFVLCLLPDVIAKFYRRTWKPLKWQILQEQKRQEVKNQLVELPEITPSDTTWDKS